MVKTSLISELWRNQLELYHTIYVGYSGGLDSTVLLHALAACPELFPKLAPIHIHHGISINADAWASHCLSFCQSLHLSLQVVSVKVENQANIEEAARTARYEAFAALITKNQCLLTAHHQDDQAETLLLHLLRGAGVKGLSGIAEIKPFCDSVLARPFLDIPRVDLESYASTHQLSWIEDESNADVYFSRNFLRHEVLPLLQTKWPGLLQNVTRTARLCRSAQANLDDLALIDYPELEAGASALPDRLAIHRIQALSEARIMNVLRYWIQKHGVRLPSEDILQCVLHEVMGARIDADPLVSWDKICIKRYEGSLYLLPVAMLEPFDTNLVVAWDNFPQMLSLPEGGAVIASVVSLGVGIKEGDRVEIRFRQGGERFHWHGQTKSLKKLMQTWLIPPWSRSRIPLLYVNDELAAVLGYANSDKARDRDQDRDNTLLRYYEFINTPAN